MKRILITGGAGFIGSNLAKRLIKDNYIVCLDNLYSSNGDNIKDFLPLKNFEFIKHDVINPIDLKVDEIYNLACPASPPFYQKDPIFTTKTCVLGALNMLELAKSNNAKILLTSTSEVYGDALLHPQNENYFGNVNPNGIRSCYDEGKRCAESLFCNYNRQLGIKTKIARIFNTYGPNMLENDGRVVSNFIMQALLNKDITIYGTGKQTRSFCYVDDMLDGLISLMNSEDDVCYPINLGNPIELTVLEIANLILEKIKSNSKTVFKELPFDDPKKRQPDISLARNKLGFQPKITLSEGLDKTIEYFRGKINA